MFVNQSKAIGYVPLFPWVLVLCSGFLCWCNLRAGGLWLTLRSHPELTLTNGIVGNNYSVQYITNLSLPGSWQILTNVALETSSNTWTDLGGNVSAQRFYRAELASLQRHLQQPSPGGRCALASGLCARWFGRPLHFPHHLEHPGSQHDHQRRDLERWF